MTVYVTTGINPRKSEMIKFSGGELHVKIPEQIHTGTPHIMVAARIQSSDDLMELVMATDILRHQSRPNSIFELLIPYFPYARQDRRTDGETAFSLKAFAQIINSLKYDSVTVYDPHSDVVAALIDNCFIFDQQSLISIHKGLDQWIKETNPVIVAPDAGAQKKAWKVAQHYNLQIVSGHKHRNTVTGAISGTSVHFDDVQLRGKTCLIVDDICDGGGTFIPLADALRQLGAEKIALYVTHGIFSKGYDVFAGHIDRIYCTDSFLPKSFPLPDQTPLFMAHVTPIMMKG